MDGAELKNKDIIIHEKMSVDQRNAELERLRKESEAATEWEDN